MHIIPSTYGIEQLRRNPVVEELVLPPLWGSKNNQHTQLGFVFAPQRFNICVAGTKSGKTRGCAEWMVARAWSIKGLHGWFAPSYRQAEVGFNECAELLPPSMVTLDRSKMVIRVASGSVIEFKTGEKPDLIYGPKYMTVVIDEASRFRQAAMEAVLTTTTVTRAPCKFIANAKGMKHWFFRWFKRAKNGEAGMSWHKIKTKDNPFIPRAAIKDAKDHLPDKKFRELYEAEFFDDAASLFPAWMDCVNRKMKPDAVTGHRYIAGLDLAKSRDFLALTIGCICCGRLHFFEQWNKVSWPASIQRIKNMVQPFGKVQLWTDETGMGGQAITDFMRRSGLWIEGCTFTNEFKEQLVADMQLATEKKEVTHPGWPLLDDQMENLEAEQLGSGKWRYEAPEGEHDDAAFSALLWNYGRKQLVDGGHSSLLNYSREQVEHDNEESAPGTRQENTLVRHQSGAVRSRR